MNKIPPVTSIEFKKYFTDFETENNLFDYTIKDLPYWDYLRDSVFNKLLNFVPDYRQSKKTKKRNYKELLYYIPILIRNFLLVRKKYDLVFINIQRRKIVNGKEVNIYIFPFIEYLKEKYSILLFDDSPLNIDIESNYPCPILRTRMNHLIDTLKNKFYRFSQKDKKYFTQNETAIEKRFQRKINMHLLSRQHFFYQYFKSKSYYKLFERIKPRLVVFCEDGNMKGMITAAKQLHIPTVQIQHGITTPICYNYPEKVRRNYFPGIADYILTFGNYWNEKFLVPSKTIAVGWPHLEQGVQKYNGIPKENSIIIISGSYSKKDFIAFAMELSDICPDLKIYYKLRVEDYINWQERYPKEFQSRSNIKVIDNEEITLHEYFAKCLYQIGTNSTGLYEGLCFNVKTFILKVGWYKDNKDLYESGIATLVSNAAEAAGIIKQRNIDVNNRVEQFFKSNTMINIEEAVELILTKQS